MSGVAIALGKPESRPWRESLLWLAALTPFFYTTYGFANWMASLRPNVPSAAFGWEHNIPFLAWTIVPYWSTDLLYAGALFLCSSRLELRTLVQRLIATQVLCVCGFLLVPLRFEFARPHAEGVFGNLFQALTSFDLPFNQAPSLHVALTAVLWATYGRHFSGTAWALIRCWFVATAFSTLTTYQHHFVDLPAGLWAGLLALAMFGANRSAAFAPNQDPLRFRIAMFYTTGALTLAAGAYLFGGASWVLLWPSSGLAIVAAAYWRGRPEMLGKSSGNMPFATRAILAPYTAGAWISSRVQTLGQPGAQEICKDVWVGRMPRTESDLSGFRSVVDLTAELPFTADRGGISYRGIPMLDLLIPTAEQMRAGVLAIGELEGARPTLVCCALGYSRSALTAAAWLLRAGESATVESAIETVRSRRPAVVIREQYRTRLAEFTG